MSYYHIISDCFMLSYYCCIFNYCNYFHYHSIYILIFVFFFVLSFITFILIFQNADGLVSHLFLYLTSVLLFFHHFHNYHFTRDVSLAHIIGQRLTVPYVGSKTPIFRLLLPPLYVPVRFYITQHLPFAYVRTFYH